MEASKMSLKLLIDAKNNKLLFAEAGKNFVDFLFHLLSLSLGAATRLLRKQDTVGSLENLYHSIENLDEAYIQPDQNKDIFLRPKPPASAPAFQLALLALEDSPEPERIQDKVFYKCSSNCCYSPFGIGSTYVTDDPRALCPNCRLFMTLRMKYVAPPQTGGGDGDSKAGGFAKGVVTYMIMDDLEVKPMSTISSIALLDKFKVKDLSALREEAVDFGMNEALKLLKASLESKTVLTSVFLDVNSETPCELSSTPSAPLC